MRGVALVLWMVAGPVSADLMPALHDVTGVAIGDMLNVRAEPRADSPIIGRLNPTARGIEVTALSADGRWGRVNDEETAGWAAIRFLARQPRPDWTALQTRMICSGTEPFWSMPVDAARGQGDLSRMGEGSWRLRIDWTAPVHGRIGEIGLGLAGDGVSGVASLTGETCSDGMSDRMSGIAIRLFLIDPTGGAARTQGLGGCCSLVP
ncbi:MAG: SH3 domain-containing protein [Gemmobacter sp.]